MTGPMETTWAKTSMPKAREELAADGADGDAGGGLAGAGAFEDVAQVLAVVLEAAREVGVAGAGAGQGVGGRGEGRRAPCDRPSWRGRGCR